MKYYSTLLVDTKLVASGGSISSPAGQLTVHVTTWWHCWHGKPCPPVQKSWRPSDQCVAIPCGHTNTRVHNTVKECASRTTLSVTGPSSSSLSVTASKLATPKSLRNACCPMHTLSHTAARGAPAGALRLAICDIETTTICSSPYTSTDTIIQKQGVRGAIPVHGSLHASMHAGQPCVSLPHGFGFM